MKSILLNYCFICGIALLLFINFSVQPALGSGEESQSKEEQIRDLFYKIQYSSSIEQCIAYCKQAIEIDPNNADAYVILAELYNVMTTIVAKTEEEKKHYLELSSAAYKIAEKLGADPPLPEGDIYSTARWERIKSNLSKIQAGMKKQEVIGELGFPDGTTFFRPNIIQYSVAAGVLGEKHRGAYIHIVIDENQTVLEIRQ